jgi:dephospho-CoA kinase
MTYVVALTGGIGTGKSTVAELFEKRGAGIVDTDEIARGLTRSGTPQFKAILKMFGNSVLGKDGELARDALRAMVFSNSGARLNLEQILHPPIRAEALLRVSASSAPYVILVVPLLVETGGYDFVKRTLVVDCPPELQVERVKKRSGLDSDQVNAIISAQATRESRLSRADDVLMNDGSLDAVARQVADLHERYLQASREFR